MNLFSHFRGARLWAATALLPLVLTAADQDLGDINRPGGANLFAKPIPVYITGYSGEVDSVLKNDLFFMGMDSVPEAQANYILSGKFDGSQIEGSLMDKVNKNYLTRQAFRGGNARVQAHTLADTIAVALARGPGIARTKVAFKAKKGQVSEVFISDYDGFNLQQVTQDSTLTVAPCWAGREVLYYTSYKLGNPDIYYHKLTTGERHPIARYLGLNTSAAVSPDGQHVAMILSKSGNPELYVSDLGGGNLRRLTTTPQEESSPCWSPDSREICYTSRASGINRLYRISAEGGAPRQIATIGASNCTEPSWSPDGKLIAFTSQAGSFRVCVVEAKGGEAVVLVEGEDPSWAPNSRAIAFVKRQNGNRVLSLLDGYSKRTKDVARVWESTSQPSWSR
ncbi:MAG: PD40 domain-containing protein [Verrucomicrobia bacterium]|nr:PD40 domain-containing protein [Verrucomicrobiota bacterium]MBI3870909.1 PD40 domain-containing protein [Verrucomicrobiota bacterium]